MRVHGGMEAQHRRRVQHCSFAFHPAHRQSVLAAAQGRACACSLPTAPAPGDRIWQLCLETPFTSHKQPSAAHTATALARKGPHAAPARGAGGAPAAGSGAAVAAAGGRAGRRRTEILARRVCELCKYCWALLPGDFYRCMCAPGASRLHLPQHGGDLCFATSLVRCTSTLVSLLLSSERLRTKPSPLNLVAAAAAACRCRCCCFAAWMTLECPPGGSQVPPGGRGQGQMGARDSELVSAQHGGRRCLV